MDKGPSHYDILRVAETASQAEIEAAYLRRKREFHPELNQEWLATLREAYDVLSDEQKREAYDQKREREREEDEQQKRLKQAAAKKAELKPPPAEINLLFDEVETPPIAESLCWGAPPSVWPSRLAYCDALRSTRVTEPAIMPVPLLRRTPPPDQRWWPGVTVIGAIIALLLILALARDGNANHSATTTATPTTASPIDGTPASAGVPTTSGTGYQERAAANRRIAQLSFACIERYICHVYGVTHTLPLFINGMDARLRQYLETHGYTDAWTDNTGSLNGQTIGPDRSSENNPNHYVAAYDINGSEVGTGLIYRDELPSNFGNGPRLAALPSSGQWEITWTLKDSAGRIVKSLTYPVRAVECTGSGAAYCGTFQSYRENAANDGTDNGHYDSTFYHPPPVFPY